MTRLITNLPIDFKCPSFVLWFRQSFQHVQCLHNPFRLTFNYSYASPFFLANIPTHLASKTKP
jgi:hypothetical protein